MGLRTYRCRSPGTPESLQPTNYCVAVDCRKRSTPTDRLDSQHSGSQPHCRDPAPAYLRKGYGKGYGTKSVMSWGFTWNARHRRGRVVDRSEGAFALTASVLTAATRFVEGHP